MAPKIRISRVTSEQVIKNISKSTNKNTSESAPKTISESAPKSIIVNTYNRTFESRYPTPKERNIYNEEHEKLQTNYYNYELCQLRQIRNEIIEELNKLSKK